MRCLFLIAAGGNLTGYSPVEVSRGFINTSIDSGFESFFHVVLPKPDGKLWKYDREEMRKKLFGDRERIKIHEVPMLRSALNGVYMATMDLYNIMNISRTYDFYDVVINLWVPFGSVIKGVLKSKFEMMSVDVPIVNITTRVLDGDRERMAKYNAYGEESILSELMGYLIDYNVFTLECERKMFFDLARKYLNFSVINRLRENSIATANAGVRCKDIDPVYERRKNREFEKVTMYFGGRWVSMKRFDDVLEITNQIYKTGRDIKGICSTAEVKSKEELSELHKKYPFIEFHSNVTKEEFFQKLIAGDFFICLSTTESFGTAFWEMSYAGLLGVFVDAPYVREVLPDDYPFIAKNEKDIPAMVMILVDMLSTEEGRIKASGYLESTRKRIREKYDLFDEDRRLYKWIKEKTDAHWEKNFKLGGSLLELAKKAGDSFDGEVFTFDQATTRMTELSDAGRQFGKKGDFMSRMMLRRIIMKAGFKDLCDSEMPKFVKA